MAKAEATRLYPDCHCEMPILGYILLFNVNDLDLMPRMPNIV